VLVGGEVDHLVDLALSVEVPDQRPQGVNLAGAFGGPAAVDVDDVLRVGFEEQGVGLEA
jgi:hypothetical protein